VYTIVWATDWPIGVSPVSSSLNVKVAVEELAKAAA
jgi:hypothetical protein